MRRTNGPKAIKGALAIAACLFVTASAATSDEHRPTVNKQIYRQQSDSEQAVRPRAARASKHGSLLADCTKREGVTRSERQICKRQAARLLGAIRTLATFGILGANGRAS